MTLNLLSIYPDNDNTRKRRHEDKDLQLHSKRPNRGQDDYSYDRYLLGEEACTNCLFRAGEKDMNHLEEKAQFPRDARQNGREEKAQCTRGARQNGREEKFAMIDAKISDAKTATEAEA